MDLLVLRLLMHLTLPSYISLQLLIFIVTQISWERLDEDLPANMGEMCFPIKFVSVSKLTQPSLSSTISTFSLWLFYLSPPFCCHQTRTTLCNLQIQSRRRFVEEQKRTNADDSSSKHSESFLVSFLLWLWGPHHRFWLFLLIIKFTINFFP